MKKLYYTCSIEASYMAKKFGVKFQVAAYDKWGQNHVIVDCYPNLGEDATYFVHPDSMHLFEPIIGDMIQYQDQGLIIRDKIKLGHTVRAMFEESWQPRIIQRTGKPFIMPHEKMRKEKADEN